MHCCLNNWFHSLYAAVFFFTVMLRIPCGCDIQCSRYGVGKVIAPANGKNTTKTRITKGWIFVSVDRRQLSVNNGTVSQELYLLLR